MVGITVSLLVILVQSSNMLFAAGILSLMLIGQMVELFHFVSNTNRKLTKFLESIKYQDFTSGFNTDHRLGRSFRDLNVSFNAVLEAFRKARSEKEEHWQYLNTIVQQVRTGIISFDADGKVELINSNARKIIGINPVNHLDEIKHRNQQLWESLTSVEPGKGLLYKSADYQLSIQATELRVRGNAIKLITLQNIQSELQRQEVEAWQNLTRVLRHEIMNSITPISSLTSTLREILDLDMSRNGDHFELKEEGATDLREGLFTIENRSKGLIKFIDAYREYTSLPAPKLKTIRLKDHIDKIARLLHRELDKPNISFYSSCESEYLTLQADEEMIEQVLINLIKNAIEAIDNQPNGKIFLRGKFSESAVIVEVEDNGPGIIPEAMSKIFVPFFTTKKTGSGIGLSLSRQILQMHHGSLTVESEPGIKTLFLLKF